MRDAFDNGYREQPTPMFNFFQVVILMILLEVLTFTVGYMVWR